MVFAIWFKFWRTENFFEENGKKISVKFIFPELEYKFYGRPCRSRTRAKAFGELCTSRYTKGLSKKHGIWHPGFWQLEVGVSLAYDFTPIISDFQVRKIAFLAYFRYIFAAEVNRKLSPLEKIISLFSCIWTSAI